MFQSVRPNSQVFIFHKGNTTSLDVGYVTNQPMPKPKYSIPQTFGQPQEMVVDLVVKVGETTLNLNGIPANLDIADTYSNGESIVVSTSREAMSSEVISTQQKSIDAVNSYSFNKDRIAKCDEILGVLNPEFAEKQVQKEEMNDLKAKVTTLSDKVDKLVDMMLQKHRNNE